jgi:Uma2 family endonuclease
MIQPALDAPPFTYADYLNFPADERWELIRGEAYAMGPAPNTLHQQVAGELFRQIANFLHNRLCEVFSAPFDVRLPQTDAADEHIETVVQPDITVICNPDKIDERGCLGAPDWIIEILSPATAAKDQIIKRALYEQHGVTEYWLVHPVDRIVTVYRLQDGKCYGKPDLYETTGQLPSTLFADFIVDWDAVFSR